MINRSAASPPHLPQTTLRGLDPIRGVLATIGALVLLLGVDGCGERSDSTAADPPTRPSSAAAASDLATSFPLQAWMKGTATPAMAARSPEALAQLFDRIQSLDPPGYAGWKSIAGRGAAAARAGDVEGCRLVCKSCHDQYRRAYRAKDRARPLR